MGKYLLSTSQHDWKAPVAAPLFTVLLAPVVDQYQSDITSRSIMHNSMHILLAFPYDYQIWSSSKELLMRKLGTQTGSSLWQHAHGIDNRPVEPPKARRSVGAEVNWGVRFSSDADAHKFLKVSCCCG